MTISFSKKADSIQNDGEARPGINSVPALVFAIASTVFSILVITLSPDSPVPVIFGTVFPRIAEYYLMGVPFFAFTEIARIAIPVLMVVFVAVFAKKNYWIAMLPLAGPLVVQILNVFFIIFGANTYNLLEIFSYIIGHAFLPTIVYGATALVAYLCITKGGPRKTALIGFGCIAVLSLLLLIAGQQPFASSGWDSSAFGYGYQFRLASLFSFLCLLASGLMFILEADKAGLTPLYQMKRRANAKGAKPASRPGTGRATPQPPQEGTTDSAEELLQLKRLLDAGAITQEDFNQKKAEVLKQP